MIDAPPQSAHPSRPAAPRRTLVRPHLRRLAAVVLLQAVGGLLGLVPLIAVIELGRVLLRPGPVDPDRVWLLVGTGALGLLGRVAFSAASSGVGHFLDTEVQLSLRRSLAEHLGRVPIGWLSQRRAGELAAVVGDDVSSVHPFIAHTPGTLVSAFLIPLVSVGYLFTVDWRLTLVTLAPVVLALALIPLMATPRRLREQEQFDAGASRIAGSAVEFVEGIAEVKTFGGSQRMHRAFLTDVEGFVASFHRMVRGLAAPASGMLLLLSPPVVLLTVLTGGCVLITSGRMPAADVLPFLLLGLGVTAPLSTLVGHGLEEAPGAWRALGRVDDMLAVPPLPAPTRPAVPEGNRVELRGVRFAHESGSEVLRGVDLVLEPGTVTALVGPSGSGKSTLAQLLVRFFDPTAGSVLLGGADLREIDDRELHRRVSSVLQDVRLLRASVADNIALAVPHADRDAVVRAARSALIHDRILELPHGYDTVLGDGTSLSGGEAQRLSLARALLADSPVLVLDEATAFADPVTERALTRTVATLAGTRTILVIAHRPESIRRADSVIVLENGTVVEHRTPMASARGGRSA